MAKVLFLVTSGLENPINAARAFLLGRTAVEEGHTVTFFLSGSAVNLVKDSVLQSSLGISDTKMQEYFSSIIEGQGMFYLSKNWVKLFEVSLENLDQRSVKLSSPKDFIRLSLEHDTTITL